MTDHPAIVALAKAQYERHPYYDEYDRPTSWDKLDQDYRNEQIADAVLDYAFVLKDLMAPSDEVLWKGSFELENQMKMLNASDYRDEASYIQKTMLRARAREIGVEIG